MKGDFTRSTFKKENHYHGVLMQQGRVQLDADWNEQLDITAHRTETGTKDILGHCAAPIHYAGFRLVAKTSDLTTHEQALPENKKPGPLKGKGNFYITGGRFYAGGILCQNNHITPYTNQPDLPGTKAVTVSGTYLAYLEVWQRHLTALEAPDIREKALDGPDTATRVKTVWQVRLLPVGNEKAVINCPDSIADWKKLITPPSGKMAAKSEESAETDKPCILSPGAGYRRLENQFYRVEVHKGGSLGKATFKWSRDNGSIVTRWEKQAGNKLTVTGSGKDDVLNFSSGDWVELTDDNRELNGKRGVLVQLEKVEGQVLTIKTTTINDPDDSTATSVDITDFRAPKVRRWDSDGVITPPDSKWVHLEDGVQVRFSTGNYRTGDYWQVPARTVTEDVEWPLDPATNLPQLQSPHGIERHYCRLGLLRFKGNAWTGISDCRPKFPPITQLTRLSYISGDGQEAMPGDKLPKPLQVGVSNGEWPVEGAVVSFSRTGSGGELKATPNNTVVPSAPGKVTVLTDENGIAECNWKPDGNQTNLSQQVEAVLLDAVGGNVKHLPIRFNANLSVAAQVSYTPGNCDYLKEKGADNVQDALDELCKRESHGGCSVTVGKGGKFEKLDDAVNKLLAEGQTNICICLLPGDHPLPNGIQIMPTDSKSRNINVKISGCGVQSRILLGNQWHAANLMSFTLQSVMVYAAGGSGLVMSLSKCQMVTLESCYMQCYMQNPVMVRINNAWKVKLEDNFIFPYNAPGKALIVSALKAVEDPNNPKTSAFLFDASGPTAFAREDAEIVAAIARLDKSSRAKVAAGIKSAVAEKNKKEKLSRSELTAYTNFIKATTTENVNEKTLTASIGKLPTAIAPAISVTGTVARPEPGVALAILDGNGEVTLENNTFMGVVSLYGVNVSETLMENELKDFASMRKEGQITLSGGNGTLNINNNRIARMVLGKEFLDRVRVLLSSEGGGILSNLFRASFITNNILEGGRNQWAGLRMNYASNFFSAFSSNIGINLAEFTVFTGNQVDTNNVLLFNSSKFTEQAGNLMLTVVDL